MLLLFATLTCAGSEVLLLRDAQRIAAAQDQAELRANGGVVRSVIGNSFLIIQRKDKSVVILPAHTHLRCGRVRPGAPQHEGYLLEDVHVGDTVCLNTLKEGKVVSFVDVQIFARPGGLVPPSRLPNPHEKDGFKPYHVRINLANAERAKIGIFPDK